MEKNYWSMNREIRNNAKFNAETYEKLERTIAELKIVERDIVTRIIDDDDNVMMPKATHDTVGVVRPEKADFDIDSDGVLFPKGDSPCVKTVDMGISSTNTFDTAWHVDMLACLEINANRVVCYFPGSSTWTNLPLSNTKIKYHKGICSGGGVLAIVGYSEIVMSTGRPIMRMMYNGGWYFVGCDEIDHADFISIAYGNGYFFIVPDNGPCAILYNLETSLAKKIEVEQRCWKYVAYGRGMFVAVGNRNRSYGIYANGKWTEGELPENPDGYQFTRIVYGDGKFVATMEPSRYIYVYENDVWTVVEIVSYRENIYGLAYGAGRFVIIKYNSAQAIVLKGGVQSLATVPTLKYIAVEYCNGFFGLIAADNSPYGKLVLVRYLEYQDSSTIAIDPRNKQITLRAQHTVTHYSPIEHMLIKSSPDNVSPDNNVVEQTSPDNVSPDNNVVEQTSPDNVSPDNNVVEQTYDVMIDMKTGLCVEHGVVHECDEQKLLKAYIGKPVFFTGNVYKMVDNEWIPSTENDSQDCIGSVKFDGEAKEYAGIVVSVDAECKSLTFATHGDYLFKVDDSTKYSVGDIVLYDGTVLSEDSVMTIKLAQTIVGQVTAIINDTTIAVFKT